MPNFVPILAAASLTLSLAASPTYASKESDAAAAALLLLGVAALAHNSDHHANGKHHDKAENVADFDRGYNDGLYNAGYDSRYANLSYSDGFSAGMKERDNRLAHRRPGATPKTPTKALKACVHKAAERWDRKQHEIHVTKSRRAGGKDYFVELAAGHRHGKCEVSAKGKIIEFHKGRI